MTVPWLIVAAAARGAAGTGAAARRTAVRGAARGAAARGAAGTAAVARGKAAKGVVASLRRPKSKKLRSRQRSRQPAATDVDLLVGDCTESDAQHRARHARPESMQNCPRYLAMRSWGEIARLAPWMAPRPCHLSGAWRMVCRVCAAGRSEEQVRIRRGVHIGANAKLGFCKQGISRCSV